MFNTFRGGIHPPQRKTLTENQRIENLSVPQICHISMQQHTGVPAVPIVEIGDVIREGELIGQAQGSAGANVHSAVPGKVIDIIEIESEKGKDITVIIEAEGAFTTTCCTSVINDWKKTDKSLLLDIVHESGIIGLDGASSLSTAKKPAFSDLKIDTLIVNGLESEPYLTAYDMLMRTHPGEIIEGIQIVLKILGIKKAVIAIGDNKKLSIKAMKDIIKDITPEERITIKKIPNKYPQDAEKQLVYSVLKRVVSIQGQTVDAGVVVLNAGTVYSIREAVLFNKPLIERYLTVSGDMINRPGNYKVRIGTLISDIVEECGGLKGTPAKILLGGPLRGYSISSLNMPVVKGTSGILFLSQAEVSSDKSDPCIRCGRCISVCPAGLVPREIASAVENCKFDLTLKLRADACITCGSCSYICPSKRPLCHYVKTAKDKQSLQ